VVAQTDIELLPVFVRHCPAPGGQFLLPGVVVPGKLRLRQDPTHHGQLFRQRLHRRKGQRKNLFRRPDERSDIVLEMPIQRVVAAGEADERLIPGRLFGAARVYAVFGGRDELADAFPDPRGRLACFMGCLRHEPPPSIYPEESASPGPESWM